MPVCFHHGIPLTNGGADVPVVAGGFGGPRGCCVAWTGGTIGAVLVGSVLVRRDPPRVFCHDNPVPGSDSVT
jgi:hypothetical protein